MNERIPGKPSKTFQVFRRGPKGDALTLVHSCDEKDEWNNFPRRNDWHYMYKIAGQWKDENEVREFINSIP